MTDWLVPLFATFLPQAAAEALSTLGIIFLVANVLVGMTAAMTFVERRLIGRMQNRIGPNRVGPNGILQPIADAIKLLLKEDIVIPVADRWVFNLAPILLFMPALAIWAVIPFASTWILADLNIGIVYVVAITSFSAIAIFMAGWGSENKYALVGAMRTVALLISYEVPMILAVVAVVLVAGSMNLRDIVVAQQVPFVLVQPMAFVIFLLAVAAEIGRTPFDLSEAESELVAGYHIEYTGMKFGAFYLSEYLAGLAWSGIIASLFFAGWRGPGPEFLDPLWWLLKTVLLFTIFIWFRGTWPRLRVDQVLGFSWKVLFPLAGLNLLITAIEVLALQAVFNVSADGTLPLAGQAAMAVVNIGVFLMAAVALSNILRLRETELPPYPVYTEGA